MSEQATSYPLPLAQPALAALVPCSHGRGCPLGVDAPAIAAAILEGDHPRAYLIARGPNPFASCCGHGCHAPCESACKRRHHGAPVAIAALEAYASGFSIPALLASPEPCTTAHDARSVAGLVHRSPDSAARAPRSGRRVAVVGGGAAGLACAHDLTLLGHTAVVFDRVAEPGGMLTRAIPSFRFPLASARAECAAILGMSVEFRGAYPIEGRDTLRALLAAEFDAIFLAIGAPLPRQRLFAAQPPHPHVVDAMEVLEHRAPLAGRAVVLGDGDLAIDAARVALRRPRSEDAAAVLSVELVLPTPLEECAVPPALLAAGLHDGIAVHAGWTGLRYLVNDDGGLLAIEIARGAVGKALACDWVVDASPRMPDTTSFGSDLARDGRGCISVDPDTLQTSLPGVWAGGACVFGHRSIAHAAADGKRAAWQIHAALTGRPVQPVLAAAWIELDEWDGTHTARALAARRIDSSLTVAPPADPFSSSALRDSQEMIQEGTRCYDCTVRPVIDETCTSCGKCVSVCPPGALSLSEEEPHVLRFDDDRCTRCGACVPRCPRGAIAMVRAVWEERLAYATGVPEPPPVRAPEGEMPAVPDFGELPPVELA